MHDNNTTIAVWQQTLHIPLTSISPPRIRPHHVRIGDSETSEDHDVWELFDLATDRSEQHDLARQHPENAQQLAKRWQQLEEEFHVIAEGPETPVSD